MSDYTLAICTAFTESSRDKGVQFLERARKLTTKFNWLQICILGWNIDLNSQYNHFWDGIKFTEYRHSEVWNINIARNRCAETTDAEYLFFVDIDMVIPADSLTDIHRNIVQFGRPTSVFYMRVIEYAPPYTQPSFDTYESMLKNCPTLDVGIKFLHPGNWRAEGLPIVPKMLFELIGGFGESFNSYGRNKQEFCYRLGIVGIQHHYISTIVYHIPHDPSVYRTQWLKDFSQYWTTEIIHANYISMNNIENITRIRDKILGNLVGNEAQESLLLTLKQHSVKQVAVMCKIHHQYWKKHFEQSLNSANNAHLINNDQTADVIVCSVDAEYIQQLSLTENLPSVLILADLSRFNVSSTEDILRYSKYVDFFLCADEVTARYLHNLGIRRRQLVPLLPKQISDQIEALYLNKLFSSSSLDQHVD